MLELIRSAIHSSRTVHLLVLKEVVNYQSIFIEIRGVMFPQNYAILDKICVFTRNVVNEPHNIPAVTHNCRLVRI